MMPAPSSTALPVRRNAALTGMIAAAAVLQYAVLPLWLLDRSLAWGWLSVPVVLLTTPWWALLHEAFHGLLHPERRINDRVGRALGIAFGTPFRVVRFGHLMHHRFNRTPLDRTEVAAADRCRVGFAAVFYVRLVIGLYLAELASAALAFLPGRLYDRAVDAAFGRSADGSAGMAAPAAQHLKTAAARRELRIDGALVLLLLGGSVWLYGEAWWILALALAGRGVLQSVADNAYHYGTPLDDRLHALNLWLPRLLERACLNFTLHRVHHHRPGLPWTRLPAAFAAANERYDAGFLAAVGRQFRGPIAPEALPFAGTATAPAANSN